MDILVGPDNHLPLNIYNDRDLIDTYMETIVVLGDLMYSGIAYQTSISSLEELYDISVENMPSILKGRKTNTNSYNNEIGEFIENMIENLLFPFFLKCVKPMDNKLYINTINDFLNTDVYNSIGMIEYLDTCDLAYKLIDKIVETSNQSITYSDDYAKYLELLKKSIDNQ